MNSPETQLIESFTYDGALNWVQGVGLFVGLALLVGWLLWRERGVTGPKTAGLFYVLRLASIGLVIWMLLGPSHLSMERTTIPQTLAIIADVSQSMNVSEPMPRLEALRWRQAIDPDDDPHPELSAVDRALVAFRYAFNQVETARIAGEEFAPPTEVIGALEVAGKASRLAIERLEQAQKSLAGDDRELAQNLDNLTNELRTVWLPQLEELSDDWARTKGSDTDERRANGVALEEDGDRLLRRVESVHRGVCTRIVAGESDRSAGDVASLSRRELSNRMLMQLEQRVLEELSETTNIKRVRVDMNASPAAGKDSWDEADQPDASTASYDAPEASTNLTAALEMIRQDAAAESIVAALLTSDGGHNTPGVAPPSAIAEGLGLPLYPLALGSSQQQRDLSIHRVEAPSSVAKDDNIVIDAIVTGHDLQGEKVSVELRQDGEVVDTRELRFDSSRQDHRLQFSVKAEELGQREFELISEILEEEVNDNNNSAVVAVRVVRDTIRLLLADRISRWEYRYLEQLWRRDPRVKYDRLLCQPNLSATGSLASTKQLPRSVEQWSQYDVAILGDMAPDFLDNQQQDAMAEWIRKRGGAAIVIAGKEHMPQDYRAGALAELLPVQEAIHPHSLREGYVPMVSREGSRHEALMLANSIPASAALWSKQYRSTPIYFLSSYSRAKPSAHVLLEAAENQDVVFQTDSPDSGLSDNVLLAWHDVGAGRVVYLAAPDTWRLRFLRGDDLHHRFWGQMLRWLTAAERGVGENRLFVQTNDTLYELGEKVEAVVTISNEDGTPVRGAQLSVQAASPTGEPIAAPLRADDNVPGRYLGSFDNLPPGAYRVTATGDIVDEILAGKADSEGSSTIITIVSPENVEMADTRGDRNLLKELAAMTSGQVLPPTAVGDALRLSAAAPRVIEDSTLTPLWNKWRYFWIVVGCLATEWGIRRMIGLV